jgi:hypothetical protein
MEMAERQRGRMGTGDWDKEERREIRFLKLRTKERRDKR